jgi:hypothetical protein
VATAECVVTGPNPNVTMETTPAFHITLEDGRGFGDVLESIRREVAQIVDAPEIAHHRSCASGGPQPDHDPRHVRARLR